MNEIFPDKIPESAIIEQFYYEYYNPWDANYLGYLVYTCDDRTFSEEYTRLKAIQSSKEYLIYGATEFPYELCAILADEYNGFIYALSDTANNRFIYVDLEFCNYICDINYSKIIDKKYLPANFDARRDIRWMTV